MKIVKTDPCKDPLPAVGTLIPSPKKPAEVADWFIQRWEDQNRRLVIRFGRFYQYNGTHWESKSVEKVKSELYHSLRRCLWIRVTAQGPGTPEPFDPSRSKLDDILDAIKGLIEDYTLVRENSWLDGRETLVIPCLNGLVRVEDSVLIPHTSTYFCTYVLQCEFDPRAKCPRTDRFMRHLANGDKESIRLLWEWYGYCLSGSNKYQKGLILKGVSGCGKGVYDRLLRLIMGKESNIGYKVSNYERNTFPSEPLYGKSVVTFSDNRVDFGHKMFVDVVLEVIGQDSTTLRKPYAKDSVNVYLTCRFMILTNLLPVIADDSGAFARRFVTVDCKAKPPEDLPDYEKTLYRELPGILNRMLQGIQRLEADRGFTQPESSAWMLETLRKTSTPELEFVDEHCVLGPPETHWDFRDSIYSEYLAFRAEEGGKPLSKAKLLESLSAQGVEERKKGGRKDKEGKWIEQQRYAWFGIKLKTSPIKLRVVETDEPKES